MPGILEQMAEIEAEMARTQKNKATGEIIGKGGAFFCTYYWLAWASL
jgi:ribosome-interacting GTPase 1